MAEIDENAILQSAELEAVSSIYGDKWKVIDCEKRVFTIDIGEDTHKVHLEIRLPNSYPSESPPFYLFSAPWMDKATKICLSLEIEDIYCKFVGESIIVMWIENIKEFISKHTGVPLEDKNRIVQCSSTSTDYCEGLSSEEFVDELPIIEHGEPIIDRRSVFQAHLAPITCIEQVNQVKAKLNENKKIATASHNIVAYRISRDSHGTFYQDCDDDGENKAGANLLHLLQIIDVRNIIVVVSRWYGGVHLGPDRFKHINNAARNLLDKCGYIKNEKKNGMQKKK